MAAKRNATFENVTEYNAHTQTKLINPQFHGALDHCLIKLTQTHTQKVRFITQKKTHRARN